MKANGYHAPSGAPRIAEVFGIRVDMEVPLTAGNDHQPDRPVGENGRKMKSHSATKNRVVANIVYLSDPLLKRGRSVEDTGVGDQNGKPESAEQHDTQEQYKRRTANSYRPKTLAASGMASSSKLFGANHKQLPNLHIIHRLRNAAGA